VKDEKRSPVIHVESASGDDVLLTEWGQELFKSSLKLVNDVLIQMISLASLLLTAALGFLERIGVGKPWQLPVFILLLTVIIVSMIGLVPMYAEIDVRDPDVLRRFRAEILRKKRLALWINTSLLTGAFLCAIIGVTTRS